MIFDKIEQQTFPFFFLFIDGERIVAPATKRVIRGSLDDGGITFLSTEITRAIRTFSYARDPVLRIRVAKLPRAIT